MLRSANNKKTSQPYLGTRRPRSLTRPFQPPNPLPLHPNPNPNTTNETETPDPNPNPNPTETNPLPPPPSTSTEEVPRPETPEQTNSIVNIPDFHIELPDFNIELPAFHIELPDFHIELPDLHIPDFNIDTITFLTFLRPVLRFITTFLVYYLLALAGLSIASLAAIPVLLVMILRRWLRIARGDMYSIHPVRVHHPVRRDEDEDTTHFLLRIGLDLVT